MRTSLQKRQRDESRDPHPHAGIDVVPTQLLDEAMQRLLVGEHRRGDHANTNGKRLVAEHHNGAEQEHNHRGNLGGQPFVIRSRLGIDEVADDNQGPDNQDGRSQDPGRRGLALEPSGHGAQKSKQCEGA